MSHMDQVQKLVTVVEEGVADPRRYVDLVKPFGLYKLRARTFASLARLAKRHGGLRGLVEGLSCEELIRELLRVPGIGAKTARIIALIKGCNYFVVDVHILRILNRLGAGCGVGFRDIYEAMDKLDGFFDYETNVRLHLCLIEIGRSRRGMEI